LPTCELHYCYAPPEAGREITWHLCKAGEIREYAPIGRPIEDVSIRVLDKRGRPTPIALTGEIFAAGQRLSRKAEALAGLPPSVPVSSGLTETEKETVRSTGDVGRWLSNGVLELSKADHGVWYGGTKIQLKQIEQALMSHPAVLDCAVLARETKDHCHELIAYVVLSDRQAGDHLRPFLEKQLPSLLIPLFFISIARLPLTATGQVDEQALASLEVIEDSVLEQWTHQ